MVRFVCGLVCYVFLVFNTISRPFSYVLCGSLLFILSSAAVTESNTFFVLCAPGSLLFILSSAAVTESNTLLQKTRFNRPREVLFLRVFCYALLVVCSSYCPRRQSLNQTPLGSRQPLIHIDFGSFPVSIPFLAFGLGSR